jgi:hypothetical protein
MIWRWQVELAIIRATIPEWKPFIFSKEIFWPLSFDREVPLQGILIPRLSSGRLLLALRLLKIYSDYDLDIQKAIKGDVDELMVLINDWQANWMDKVSQEFPARIRQWNQTINDLISPSGISNSQYNSQVYVRLLLDFLVENCNSNLENPLKNDLKLADKILLKNTFSSTFIWDPILKDGFPEERYWYLYRKT